MGTYQWANDCLSVISWLDEDDDFSAASKNGCCSFVLDGVPPMGDEADEALCCGWCDGDEASQNWCAMAHSSTLAGHEALFAVLSVLAPLWSAQCAKRALQSNRNSIIRRLL